MNGRIIPSHPCACCGWRLCPIYELTCHECEGHDLQWHPECYRDRCPA